MSETKSFIADLPDPAAVDAFLRRLGSEKSQVAAKLSKNEALLADVLALVAYSPLLAATLLQNTEYISWLGRERSIAGVRSKAELLESLARFSLTNSSLNSHVLLARFRRRELLRIFLADIRKLATVAEITEDISNLADAILENALMLARQKVDNLFGHPFEHDEKGRATLAGFCIVSLGKLGSRELNYASDIDLLFIYSAEGSTDGHGSRGAVSNREYFSKLAEEIVRLTSRHAGEGAAYRVDMRLRPNGSLGPLAMSLGETTAYYKTNARNWERQVLIRSRASAGDIDIYRQFFAEVESFVFQRDVSPLDALGGVKRSKQQIDDSRIRRSGFDVKLARGGIREIEFMAQALQLAYGGRDRWLRVQHTLISLARLSERGLIAQHELTQLYDAYAFLRRLEHILQMEHGLQTHQVPADADRRGLVARRMNCKGLEDFDEELRRHTSNVARVFDRVFGGSSEYSNNAGHVFSANEAASAVAVKGEENEPSTAHLSPYLASIVSMGLGTFADEASPSIVGETDKRIALVEVVKRENSFSERLGALRIAWARRMADIVVADVTRKRPLVDIKAAQTDLAEESIAAAREAAKLEARAKLRIDVGDFALGIFAVGKLASGGLDYESDLDIVLTDHEAGPGHSQHELCSRIAEWFVTALSGLTREGSLYRVDLRLRPFGKNGPLVASDSAFRDYVSSSAEVWELLAYLKLRAVAASSYESRLQEDIVDTVFARAATFHSTELAAETRRIRLMLEKQRARGRDVDIKYGPGGMLDIYFATRFLQLRDRVRDEEGRRSTASTLDRLYRLGSLAEEDHRVLTEGYEFLSGLDHAIRLTYGRTTRFPGGNARALEEIALRLELTSVDRLTEQLALHRLSIRDALERVLGNS